jgi:futalosine hydrolase
MELQACLALLPASGEQDQARQCPAALDGLGNCEGVAPVLRLPGCALELLLCGVGPLAAALSLGHRLGREGKLRHAGELQGILNLGLAGTYDPDKAPVGSLVLATDEAYPEYGIWTHYEDKRMPLSFPQAEIAGRKVFSQLALEPDRALGNIGLNWHSGLQRGGSITVAGVSGTPQRAGRMALFANGLTENMEGFPLALGAAAAHIPFVELRAVSNIAGQRPPHGWNIPAALASLGEGMRHLLAPFLRAGETAGRDSRVLP